MSTNYWQYDMHSCKRVIGVNGNSCFPNHLWKVTSREALRNNKTNPFPEKNGKPALLNTCFAFDERSEVTEKQWPNYFKKD